MVVHKLASTTFFCCRQQASTGMQYISSTGQAGPDDVLCTKPTSRCMLNPFLAVMMLCHRSGPAQERTTVEAWQKCGL